jgi:hypothetical protein
MTDHFQHKAVVLCVPRISLPNDEIMSATQQSARSIKTTSLFQNNCLNLSSVSEGRRARTGNDF